MSALPEHVARLRELMSTYPAPWALCGGWAVDAWLGEESRKHGDVDVIVFQDDHETLFRHLDGWAMVAHHPHVWDGTDERWDGRRLDVPAHIHCPAVYAYDQGRIYSEDGFNLDVQVNERAADDWVIGSEPRLAMPLANAVQPSRWGMPAVVPEVLLWYKATGERTRRRDERDFQALLPGLTAKKRAWLHEAIAVCRPDHAWVSQLSAEPINR